MYHSGINFSKTSVSGFSPSSKLEKFSKSGRQLPFGNIKPSSLSSSKNGWSRAVIPLILLLGSHSRSLDKRFNEFSGAFGINCRIYCVYLPFSKTEVKFQAIST